MDEQLVAELKLCLNITWSDEDTNNRLLKLIEQGKAYLYNLTGASFNFSTEAWPKELLLERCRYVYNNAGDEFEKNYQGELQRLQLQAAIGKAGVKSGTLP